MSDDWDTVTVLRKKAPTGAAARSASAVNAAQRTGAEVEVTKKFSAATNSTHKPTASAVKVDAETEDFHIDRVPLKVSQLIQQGRAAKGLTQKELATKINEKPQVIGDYEAGRSIPDPAILGKIERIVGIKLRGKDIGKALS
eukprot:m.27332 g.27332  ORF g.27332 m.27332 type:complete len:142 (+) comp39699_c0_seq1:153-578(+)